MTTQTTSFNPLLPNYRPIQPKKWLKPLSSTTIRCRNHLIVYTLSDTITGKPLPLLVYFACESLKSVDKRLAPYTTSNLDENPTYATGVLNASLFPCSYFSQLARTCPILGLFVNLNTSSKYSLVISNGLAVTLGMYFPISLLGSMLLFWIFFSKKLRKGFTPERRKVLWKGTSMPLSGIVAKPR